MDNGTPKQQIAERIKNATNILVTVSRDPSVDELSAALALTLMLNKADKHATAVFSGKIPPAITFLEPNKTFENSVDSLRDFIIALDKEKADRLRYKVEDDVVRIFITPYRTTITEKDLQFSQGDFNVELIVALGVERREDLDTAITAHGRILHDAATVTLNTKPDKNSLGVVDWQEPDASSLCEMLVSLDEFIGTKIDEQIATALLTGVVAATQRFKNIHTSPRVMTMAAQLMAAGANQQLIASKLEEAQAIPQAESAPVAKDGTTKLDEGESTKIQSAPTEEKKADGEMDIVHEKDKMPGSTPEQKPEQPKQQKQEQKKEASRQKQQPQPQKQDKKVDATAVAEANKELDAAISQANGGGQPGGLSVDDLKKDLASASQEMEKDAQKAGAPEPKIESQSWRDKNIEPPKLGGTLNATTESAEEENREAEADDRNRTILTHDKPSMGTPMNVPSPMNSYAPGVDTFEPPSVDPFGDGDTPLQAAPSVNATPPASPPPPPPMPPAAPPAAESVTPALPPAPAETIADLEAQTKAKHAEDEKPKDDGVGDARRAVEDALNAMPFDPAHKPVDSLGAEPLSLPHINQAQPPQFEAPAAPNAPAPVSDSNVNGALPITHEQVPPPPPPPMPDFSALPPLPPAPASATPVLPPAPTSGAPASQPGNVGASSSPLPPLSPPAATPPPSASPASNDPSQFRIPGQ